MGMPSIVIVGGGAGGFELAARLGGSLGRTHHAQIHLVDKNLTNIWKPLWHEVAAGTTSFTDTQLNYFVQGYRHYFNFHLGNLADINLNQQLITLSNVNNDNLGLEMSCCCDLHYDYLVLAIGSVHNNFATPGVEENCYFLDSLVECQNFQQEIVKKFIKVHQGVVEKTRIVIVGGGATGVELASELHYAFSQNLVYSRQKLNINDLLSITLIESGSRILAALPEDVAADILQQLNGLGIAVYSKQRVISMNQDLVNTESGLSFSADLKVWAAGIKAPHILSRLAIATDKSDKILVKPNLQSITNDRVYALGDCASCRVSTTEAALVPATAQAARQQALWLANHLAHQVLNHKPSSVTFKYKDFGSIISMRHNRAVGYFNTTFVYNIKLSGKIASFFYRYLYRRHQALIWGWGKTCLLMIAEWLAGSIRSRVKLH